MKKTYLLIFFCLLLQMVNGQYQIGIIPRVSPDKKIAQKIGYTDVEIQYGSPSIKNRQIWGELVPYNKVWRAGANSATTIEFGSKVEIGGLALDSGKYSFFLIPEENDKWTAIFNKTSRQWGAFRYDENEDALRLEVRPRITKFKTENLNYTINQTGFKYGSINLAWEYIEIEVPIETNYLADFAKEIETRASAQPEHIKWIPYIQGAEHLQQIKDNVYLAKEWMQRAEKIMSATKEWNDQFYPRPHVVGHLYWTKAKVMAWDGDYEEAIKYVDKLKDMEEASYYEAKREEVDFEYKGWKER